MNKKMNRTELIYHVCEFYVKNNSFSIITDDGIKVNKTTSQVLELKNKMFHKLNKQLCQKKKIESS